MGNNIRRRIEARFESFGHWVYRHHWKVLLLVLTLTGALISQLPKLTMDTSTEGFLHEEDPTLLQYNQFREQFGRDELLVIAIKTDDVFNLEFLKKLRILHHELEDRVPYLDDINSLINARDTRGSEGELQVEDLLQEWPKDKAALEEIRKRALSNRLYTNLLLSEDATVTTIAIKTDAFTSKGMEEDVMAGFGEESPAAAAETRPFLSDAENSEMVNVARHIVKKYDGPEFRTYIAGSPVVADVLKRSMQSNLQIFMLLALVFIALVLAILFRRVSGVALPFAVVIISLLSTLGLMGSLGIPFKLPTQIVPSFLIAVGVGASVHLLAIFYRNLQQGDSKEDAIARALGHSGLAIVMTSLTTAAGLASFSGAEVAPISDLGIIASTGILIALVYTLVLIPALLSIFPIQAKSGAIEQQSNATMDRVLTSIADFSTRHSRLVLAISAVFLIVGLTGASKARFTHKPYEWLSTEEPVRQANDFVDQNMKGASFVEVVVDTGKENGLYEPAVMRGLEQLNREVEAIHNEEIVVGKTLSLADILKETHQALNENREEFYTIPDDRQLIAQELLLFENSGSDDLEDFVDSRFQTARFTAKLPWADGVYYSKLIDDLNERFHRVLGADVKVAVTGMVALLSRTMYATILSMSESYLIAAGVITLMMILLIGNLRIGLVSMIPNLTPIILTLGIIGWFGMPLDLFTILIGSIAIGLAVDDTIHFMHNYRRYHHDTGDVDEAVRRTLLTTGRAMLVTTIVLAIGFFIYVFSNMYNIRDFGILTGFTIIMALLADFFLAPALMKELHRSRLISDDSDY